MRTTARAAAGAALLVFCVRSARSQESYYTHVIFDNSLSAARSFYTEGQAIGPSQLVLNGGRLPIETAVFRSPPNALQLEWKSAPGGSWEAVIRVEPWRNRTETLDGDTLFLWCYSKDAISATALPRLQLVDREGRFSVPVPLRGIAPSIPAGHWTRVSVPLRAFTTLSLHRFAPNRLASLHFLQGAADNQEHTLLLDEITVDRREAAPGTLIPPRGLHAKGYERHVDLTWTPPAAAANIRRYVIYRSLDGTRFQPVGIQAPGLHRYADYLGKEGTKAYYRVTSGDANYRESPPSAVVQAATHVLSDDELLDMVEEASIRYYWEAAHPVAGATLENVPGNDNVVALGASGFGIMAVIAGAERGFITRPAAAARILKIVHFLESADRYHGSWPHFLDGQSGKTMPVFGKYDNGGDLVETAFMIQGLLTARGYFSGTGATERSLRDRITSLWDTVEWDWYRMQPDSDFLFWHWSPDYTWRIHHRLIGWNETMIVYLLAMASRTHAIPARMYYSGWASQSDIAVKYRRGDARVMDGDHYTNGHTYYGIKLDVGVRRGGPLFFIHYSYLGMDPHAITDRYTNYFANSRNIALISRAYSIDNPHGFPDYGRECWGLTAADGPWGYAAHEATEREDDGTVVPTGALSSMPYTPEASLEALKHFYREHGKYLWDIYGFRDAFNVKEDWYSRIHMGLNQAPIAIMIENYRSGAIWKAFMSNPEIRAMLDRSALGGTQDKNGR